MAGPLGRQNAALVNRLIDVIATKPTLMMGLSAQDANIQTIFAAAEARLAWPWPGDRPSYVFSEDRLGADQQSLLRNVYLYGLLRRISAKRSWKARSFEHTLSHCLCR